MSIYKDCDIRGIYGRELQADEVTKIGRALAGLCGDTEIPVGGDVRTSTPELKDALIAGLVRGGARVIDIGTIPTPALYFYMKHIGARAGATVTASHNPPEYNGIKFMLGDMPVTRQTIDRLRDAVAAGNFCEGAGTVEAADATGAYLAFLQGRFSAPRRLHILVDAGNGAMSDVAPKAFRAAGYRVTELYCECDGTFPNRSPNPSDYTCLAATGAAVRACGADIGVAFDGDGDRAVFLNERGEPIRNERSLILFIRALLADRKGSVVYDQKSSSAVRDAIVSMGGTPLPERSGHAFIKRRFLENKSVLAGEVSGHFFFEELGYDDGLFAALVMAGLVGAQEKTLGELTDEIFMPPITPDIRVYCPYDRQEDCLRRAEAAAVQAGGRMSYLDGVRADFPDGWFLIRKSVTAEQITLRAEAQTQKRLDELLCLVRESLPEAVRDALKFR